MQRPARITTSGSASGPHGGGRMKTATIAAAILAALTFALPAARAQQPDKEHEELAKALSAAKIPLQRGLTASAKEGKPISGKYEVEHGQLQLSVYTMKGDKFSEVIVDHKTGKVAKTEPITGGDDLTAAKKQAAAMAKTKRSLRDVVAKAEKSNAGYKAVGVWADMESSGAKADVNLLKGSEAKHLEDKL